MWRKFIMILIKYIFHKKKKSIKAKLAQSAARKSHNLKVVSSNLTLRTDFIFYIFVNHKKAYIKQINCFFFFF